MYKYAVIDETQNFDFKLLTLEGNILKQLVILIFIC